MFKIRAVIIAYILLIPAIWVYSETPKEIKQEERKGVLITTAKAELMAVERFLLFVGELQAEKDADVKAEAKGKVLEIYKDLGDAVKKGELIARLDSDEYRISHEQATQALKEAQAKYELARLNRDRADGLFKKGLISERESDEARESLNGLEATVKEREAALKMSTKKLRDTEIVAPFAGVIKERYSNVGDYVDDKAVVASVISISPLKLRASVPEKAAGAVRKGMKVFVKVEAYPEKVFEGSIVRVSPSLEPKTRSLPIEAAFPNNDGVLKPGFFAKGKIVIKGDDKGVFVSESSLISFAGVKKVFVIENEIASERVVKVGERVGDSIEITEGVREGEVIATSALNKLSTGIKVEVKR